MVWILFARCCTTRWALINLVFSYPSIATWIQQIPNPSNSKWMQGEEMQGNDNTASVRMGGGAWSTQALCCCQELISNTARMTFEEGQISLKKGKSGGALHCILASNWWAVKRYLNGAKIFSFTDAVQLNHYKTLQVASFMLLHLCFRSLFIVTKGQMWSEPWCSSPRALLYSAATSLWPKSPLQNRRTT